MADEETVTLIAPNGMQVGIAASKRAEFLATGYRLPESSSVDAPPVKPVAKKAAKKAPASKPEK